MSIASRRVWFVDVFMAFAGLGTTSNVDMRFCRDRGACSYRGEDDELKDLNEKQHINTHISILTNHIPSATSP